MEKELTRERVLAALVGDERNVWDSVQAFPGATMNTPLRTIAALRLEKVKRDVEEEKLVRNLIAEAKGAVAEGGQAGPLDDLANAIEDLESYMDGPSESPR